jgi:hypothetical protein
MPQAGRAQKALKAPTLASGKHCNYSARAATAITGKRPIMGRMAAENADRVVVMTITAQRSAAIRAAILANAGALKSARREMPTRQSEKRSPDLTPARC